MDSLEARRQLWQELTQSEVWAKYRAGGVHLNGVVPEELRTHYQRLGLPWEDSEDSTVSRHTFMLWMLGRHGAPIMRFLREVMQLNPLTEEEQSVEDLALAGRTARVVDDANQVVIIDIGSVMTSVGWVGEERPVKQFRTQHNGKYPINQGFIKDFAAVEQILRKAYEAINAEPSSYPAVLTVAPKTSSAHKAKLAKIFFESFGVESLYICTSSFAALCNTDFLSGLVLNVGGGVTHAVPIYESVVLQHAIQRLDIAGNDIRDYIKNAVVAQGHSLSDEEADVIKESLSYIALDYDAELKEKKDAGKPFATAFLRDGRQFPVGEEILKGPETFFKPNILMKEAPGVHELIKKSINQCDLDVRKALWENVYVAGGASLTKGFIERLKVELQKLAPENTTVVVNEAPNRSFNTWAGASALAMSDEFFDWCITADELEESGEDLFTEKCTN